MLSTTCGSRFSRKTLLLAKMASRVCGSDRQGQAGGQAGPPLGFANKALLAPSLAHWQLAAYKLALCKTV